MIWNWADHPDQVRLNEYGTDTMVSALEESGDQSEQHTRRSTHHMPRREADVLRASTGTGRPPRVGPTA